MKFSIFYDHLQEICTQKRLDMPFVLNEAKACGIDGIEIRLSCLLENEKTVVAEIEKAGMRISCLYEFYDWGNKPDILSGKKHVDAAKRVGARKILIIPGYLSEEEAQQLIDQIDSFDQLNSVMRNNRKIQNMQTTLQQVVDYAEPYDIAVTLEDFDMKVVPASRMNQLLWFMENVQGLKFTMDTGNFAFSDENALEAYQLLKKYVVHVHCKDRARENGISQSNRNNHGLATCPVGAGYMPIEAIVRDSAAGGYDGFFAIEHFGAPDQLEYMKKSAEYLKALRSRCL